MKRYFHGDVVTLDGVRWFFDDRLDDFVVENRETVHVGIEDVRRLREQLGRQAGRPIDRPDDVENVFAGHPLVRQRRPPRQGDHHAEGALLDARREANERAIAALPCMNCGHPQAAHTPDGQCLFESSDWRPRRRPG
jgi:hypothetical protein